MKLGGEQLAFHHVFRQKHTELNEIYTVMALRSFIVSLIGIYVPIYLWNLGYSLADILIIEAILYLGEALLEIPTTYLNAYFGPRKLIAVSMPVLVAHFLILWTIPTYHWSFLAIALSGSLATALFWQAYHWDFSKSKHNHEASRDVSVMLIFSSITGALAPFLGGFIASQLGINYVFGLVAFLLLFTITPLFKKGERHLSKKIDFQKIKMKTIKGDIISYWGLATQGAVGMVVWPLLVFLIVKTYQNVGLATSAALTLSLFFTYVLGKSADHGKRKKYLRTGSVLMSLVYFIKTVASSFLHVFSLDFLSNLANSFFYAPFVSEYYLHADEESRAEYISLMEIASDLARAFVLVLLLSLTLMFNDKGVLLWGLGFAGIASLLISFMPPAKCELAICDKTIKIQRQLKAKSSDL